MSNTYIALSGLAPHWGTDHNTLPLTDGCRIRGGEEHWRNFGDPVDMVRFHGEGEVVSAQNFCNQLALSYIPLLTDALESRLNLGYGQRFYQRLVAPWLVWFIQAAYDRYMSISRAASIPGVCFLTGEGIPHPRPSALDHHCETAGSDCFNLLFYSDIVRALALPEKSLPVLDRSVCWRGPQLCADGLLPRKQTPAFALCGPCAHQGTGHGSAARPRQPANQCRRLYRPVTARRNDKKRFRVSDTRNRFLFYAQSG